MSSRWLVSELGAKHQPEISRLFRDVFGQEMSPDLWRWKYAEGRGGAMGVWEAGGLVAHYGGMGRDVAISGNLVQCVQIGDVMVAPQQRGVLTRKGPFFLATSTYFERFVGCDRTYKLAFGFPNARHVQVGELLGLYGVTGTISEVVWTPLPCKADAWSQSRRLQQWDNQVERTINQLWNKMLADFPDAVIGVRNASYVKQRYFDHPHHEYILCIVSNRWTGKPQGIFVLRNNEDGCELMDIISPLRFFPRIITHARRTAQCLGASRLMCWITDNFSHYFTEESGTRRLTDIRIAHGIWTNAISAEEVNNRWWLMSGDTDFR